jgi:hypothetical protein
LSCVVLVVDASRGCSYPPPPRSGRAGRAGTSQARSGQNGLAPSGRLRQGVRNTPQSLPPALGSLKAVMVGTEETRLIVPRGNSASGKSPVAAGLREKFGRGLALVGQDDHRRRQRPARVRGPHHVRDRLGPPARHGPLTGAVPAPSMSATSSHVLVVRMWVSCRSGVGRRSDGRAPGRDGVNSVS